jgi:hypothetical protein
MPISLTAHNPRPIAKQGSKPRSMRRSRDCETRSRFPATAGIGTLKAATPPGDGCPREGSAQ